MKLELCAYACVRVCVYLPDIVVACATVALYRLHRMLHTYTHAHAALQSAYVMNVVRAHVVVVVGMFTPRTLAERWILFSAAQRSATRTHALRRQQRGYRWLFNASCPLVNA